ncbi:uncharacterized protein LOC107271760 [Cephus cinctus]|uniref:Uncharacterized protein LOC107271760 n=1 Tax=Cephus cinctus TaxID=211228 RepID=A0AAJ7RPY9_CEPCN|nr:uncharacterized protein LOC107271760 [Cephus cinctus]XP_024945012.1 uncharacterized protein LOC107271760 [Cephus cinctus]
MGWFFLAGILLLSLCVVGLPLPQAGGGAGAHGQPQPGSPSTPGPGGGGIGIIGGIGGGAGGGGGPAGLLGGPGGPGAPGGGTIGMAGVVGGIGGSLSVSGVTTGDIRSIGTGSSTRPIRRGRGWRDWRRGDPTLLKGLWKSKGPLDSLGNAEVYIVLALLIGFVTVVIGCWLSDNCWSPEPEGVVTLA